MLTKIILLYFLIPNLIFFLSYYKIYVSIPILFCLLFFFYKTKNLNIKIKFNKKFFLGLILIIGWTSISGIFPQIYQNGDWFKHNSILYDLVEKKWPVSYGNNNLIYYIGYYLPAALLGKIFSLKISKLFLALWTLIGMVLIYILLTEKITKKINRSILFIMFGGLNFLIYFIKNKLNIAGTDQNWYTTVEWLYLPNSTALFQNTQQAIYGWLATLLLFREYKETKTVDLLPYIFTLSLIISPFISLGLIIFLPIYFSEIKKIIHRINPKNIILAIVCIIIFIFYKSSSYSSYDFYFLPFRKNLYLIWPELLLSYLCYFTIFIPIIKKNNFKKPLFVASIIMLTLLPFFHYGACNDIVMKASIPSLLILQIILFDQIQAKKYKVNNFYKIIILASFLTSLSEISHTLNLIGKEKKAYASILENQGIITEQYLGKLKNPIFRSSN